MIIETKPALHSQQDFVDVLRYIQQSRQKIFAQINTALLARELPWTHNTIIFSRCKSAEEREYYLNVCIKERYSKRELERQINASDFERTIYELQLPDKKLIRAKLHELSENGYLESNQ